MAAMSMNGLNRPDAMLNMQDSNFEKDALFYSSKPIGRKELTEVVAFELVDQKTDKIYDSIESNEFLFSEAVDDFINEDEYAIISDCDEDGSIHGENLTYGETFVTIVPENGQFINELNNPEPCKEEKAKTLDDNNQVSEEVSNVHGNQAPKASIVNEEFNSVYINKKASSKNSENRNNKKILPANINKETSVVVNREGDNEDESDTLFSFENTSTPNKDYEMKIIAGRNDLSELSQSTNKKELEEAPEGWKEQRKNKFKLKSLSTRIMRSFEDITVQTNPDGALISIPLEELRNLNSEITDKYESGKVRLFPKKPFFISSVDLKTLGPKPVVTQNVRHSVPNIIYANKGKKTVPLEQNITDTAFADKCMKRSVSDIMPPSNFDLEMASLDNQLTSCRLPDQTKERYMLKKKIKDDSFFEIDNRYGEFENNFDYKAMEFEMKTIASKTVPNDNINVLSTTTEFSSHGTLIEIFRGCEVSSRYISFFRQQKCNCKYITVAFFNVDQPKILNKLDVPCEEVIEQIYTHIIEEVIIYEDEFIGCNEDPYSVCDDEWYIVK